MENTITQSPTTQNAVKTLLDQYIEKHGLSITSLLNFMCQLTHIREPAQNIDVPSLAEGIKHYADKLGVFTEFNSSNIDELKTGTVFVGFSQVGLPVAGQICRFNRTRNPDRWFGAQPNDRLDPGFIPLLYEAESGEYFWDSDNPVLLRDHFTNHSPYARVLPLAGPANSVLILERGNSPRLIEYEGATS